MPQPRKPEEIFTAILSAPPSLNAKALAMIRECDTAGARALSMMLISAGRRLNSSEPRKSSFLYECAAEAARLARDDGLLVEADYLLGTSLLHSGDYLRAEGSLMEGARLSEKNSLDVQMINNLGMLGVVYIRLARYNAAEQVSTKALTCVTASPNRTKVQYQYGEALACGNLGTIAAWKGEHDTALHYFSRAVELFEKLDGAIGGYQPSALDNVIQIGRGVLRSRGLQKSVGALQQGIGGCRRARIREAGAVGAERHGPSVRGSSRFR